MRFLPFFAGVSVGCVAARVVPLFARTLTMEAIGAGAVEAIGEEADAIRGGGVIVGCDFELIALFFS